MIDRRIVGVNTPASGTGGRVAEGEAVGEGDGVKVAEGVETKAGPSEA